MRINTFMLSIFKTPKISNNVFHYPVRTKRAPVYVLFVPDDEIRRSFETSSAVLIFMVLKKF